MQRSGIAMTLWLAVSSIASGQTPKQPKVAPGPNEPDWVVVLDQKYGLKMFDDLLNPVKTTAEATPGLFKKAGPGPVTYTPVIAPVSVLNSMLLTLPLSTAATNCE